MGYFLGCKEHLGIDLQLQSHLGPEKGSGPKTIILTIISPKWQGNTGYTVPFSDPNWRWSYWSILDLKTIQNIHKIAI
jgi:hypothetical protein